MQKFVQYACILPCCISSQMSVANVDEPLTSPPIVQQEQTPKKIGKIIVVNNPIFDESDPNAFFIHRWANQLHINTKDYVVRDKLTFSENDTVDLKDLNESQRLLRAEPYIRDAKIYIADKDPNPTPILTSNRLLLKRGITGHYFLRGALAAQEGILVTLLA